MPAQPRPIHRPATGELYVYTGEEWISATGAGIPIINTTDDVEEGTTNLYYTQSRFDSAFTAKDTDNLAEGSNLYYTDARVQSKLSSVSGDIVPDTDVAYDIGSPTKRFRDLYLSGSTINLGDATISSSNGAVVLPAGSTIQGASELADLGSVYTRTEIDNLLSDASNVAYNPASSGLDASDVQAALDVFGETRKYWSNINSAVRMYGGIIQNNGDGTVRVAGGGGLFKIEAGSVEGVPAGECEPMALNSAQGGEIFFKTWESNPVVELTNNAYNYIFIVWDHTHNNGDGTYGRAKVHSSTNFYMNDWENELAYYTFRDGHPELNLPARRSAMLHAFTVGRVYRMDNEIIVRVCGTNGWNYNKRAQLFGEEFFPVVRARGLEIEAASGDLQFNVTEGVMWAEAANRFTVQRFDMDAGDTFTAWYRHTAQNYTGSLSAIQSEYPTGIPGSAYNILYSTVDDRYYRYDSGWAEVMDYINSKIQATAAADLSAISTAYPSGFHNYDDNNDYVILQLQATDAFYRFNPSNSTWELFTGDTDDYVQIHFIGNLSDMQTQYPTGYRAIINVVVPTLDNKYYEYNASTGWERVHGYVNRAGWTRFYQQTSVDVGRYNDVTAQKLVDLPADTYGVAWIYMVHDNSCHVVYGQDYYTQEEAKNAKLPAPLPGLVAAYSTLVGKITFTAGVTNFDNASLESPFQEKFISSGVSLHNDLAGLNGGNPSTNEYYHLDETAYNLLNTFAEEIDVDASGNLAVAGVVTSSGISTSGNIELTGALRGPATFTIDPSSHGDNTGTVVIAGNLQVDGVTTTVNSTTVSIDDKNLILADNATTASEANGAGITVGGANATITYTSVDDRWNFNRGINVAGAVDVDGVVYSTNLLSTGYISVGSLVVNDPGSNYYSWNNRVGGQTVISKPGISPGSISLEDETPNAHLTLAGTDAKVRLHLGTYNDTPYAAYIQASYDNSPSSSGSTGYESLALNPQGGQVTVGTSDLFPTSSVALYVKGGASGWSVFERNNKRLYVNANYSDTNTVCQITSEAASNMAMSISAREQLQDLYLGTNGNIGMGTDQMSTLLHVNGRVTVGGHGATPRVQGSHGLGIVVDQSHVFAANSDIGDTNRQLNVTNDSAVQGAYTHLGFRVNPAGTTTGNHMLDMKLVSASPTQSSFYVTMKNPSDASWADRMRIDSDGKFDFAGHLIPHSSNTYDLGTSSYAWRNIYTGDLHMSNEGHETGNSIDGTKGNWTVQEGAEDLYLINNKTGKKYKFKLEEIQ